MKKLVLSAILVVSLVGLSGARLFAYDHDDKGWYDKDHHRHAFITHDHHRGYWDTRNGVRLFINVD